MVNLNSLLDNFDSMPAIEKTNINHIRVKYILTTSKEVRKCKFFILGGLFLFYALHFSKTDEADI